MKGVDRVEGGLERERRIGKRGERKGDKDTKCLVGGGTNRERGRGREYLVSKPIPKALSLRLP